MYDNLETNLSMHVWLSSCPSTVSSSYPPNSGLNNHSKIELLFTIGNLLLFNEYSLKEIYYHDVKSQPKTKPLWNFMKLQFFPNWLTKISNELGLFLGYFRPTNEYNIVDIKPTPNANIFEFNNCMQCWKGGNHQIRTYVAQIYVISYKNHGQNYYRPL